MRLRQIDSSVQPGDEPIMQTPLVDIPRDRWAYLEGNVEGEGVLHPGRIYNANDLRHYIRVTRNPRHPLRHEHDIGARDIRVIPRSVVDAYLRATRPDLQGVASPVRQEPRRMSPPLSRRGSTNTMDSASRFTIRQLQEEDATSSFMMPAFPAPRVYGRTSALGDLPTMDDIRQAFHRRGGVARRRRSPAARGRHRSRSPVRTGGRSKRSSSRRGSYRNSNNDEELSRAIAASLRSPRRISSNRWSTSPTSDNEELARAIAASRALTAAAPLARGRTATSSNGLFVQDCPDMSHLARYISRPSPPYPAQRCRDVIKQGNDGLMYQSVPDRRGVYTWRKLR